MSPNPFIVYGSAVIRHCAALCTIEDDLKRGRNFKLSTLYSIYSLLYKEIPRKVEKCLYKKDSIRNRKYLQGVILDKEFDS